MDMQKRKKPKIVWFHTEKSVDEEDAGINVNYTDRIPSVLNVTWFDLFCFGFAMCSYLLDFFSDIAIAMFHFFNQRQIEGALIITFSLIPSFINNFIAYQWMKKDEKAKKDSEENSDDLIFSNFVKIAFCVFQIGPCYFYFKAFFYGTKFLSTSDDFKQKRLFFTKMVDAEKNATVLRCFEAFLESSPQLIIQGVILARFFLLKPENVPIWILCQCASLLISTFSISWSLVVHNRTLRMVSDDKINLWPKEIILQICWRFLSVSSRLALIFLCVSIFKYQVLYFIAVHWVISIVHIIFLQAFHMQVSTLIEVLLILLNSFIHIFTPFNMAEGRTRYRYITAYSIEFLEILIVSLVVPNYSTSMNWIFELKIYSITVFLLGISVMCIYYKFFHPNSRRGMSHNDTERTLLENIPENV